MVQSSASLPVIAPPTTLPTAAICPYLLAADERWRSASPAREHRCTAVAPASILSIDKQRRLCLTPSYGRCATHAAALGLGALGAEPGLRDAGGGADARVGPRPLPRTAPVVMDHGRLPVMVSAFRPDRGLAQLALLVLMVVAFGAIVLSRVSAPSPDGRVLAGVAGTPGSDATAGRGDATSTPRVSPAQTGAPSTSAPTRPAGTDPGSSEATDGPTTYTVRRGDTLSGIAAEFGTTLRALRDLNGIDDPSRLRVGQVLELP